MNNEQVAAVVGIIAVLVLYVAVLVLSLQLGRRPRIIEKSDGGRPSLIEYEARAYRCVPMELGEGD